MNARLGAIRAWAAYRPSALAGRFGAHIFGGSPHFREARPLSSVAVQPNLRSHMRSSVGLTLILIGAILVVVGLLTWLGALSWFGRLPGDIRIERPNMRMYIPLTSMLLVSLVLSGVAALIHRFR